MRWTLITLNHKCFWNSYFARIYNGFWSLLMCWFQIWYLFPFITSSVWEIKISIFFNLLILTLSETTSVVVWVHLFLGGARIRNWRKNNYFSGFNSHWQRPFKVRRATSSGQSNDKRSERELHRAQRSDQLSVPERQSHFRTNPDIPCTVKTRAQKNKMTVKKRRTAVQWVMNNLS